jgi:thymidylate kinase
MKNKFICFEGVDGSGKTTLAKLLAKEIDAKYYYSPPEMLLPIRTEVYEYDVAVRFQYYLLGNTITSEDVKKTLRDQPVIVDRYVYSTLAFHFPIEDENIPNLLLPDRIIYVTASWREIENRLSQREHRKSSEQISYLQLVHQQYQRMFSGLNNVVKIDTTNEAPTESISKIIQSLEVKNAT